MAMSESFHQLPCPTKNLIFGQLFLLGDDLIQPPAVDIIHHQVGIAVLFEMISDARYVGMAKICQQARFLPELLAKLR